MVNNLFKFIALKNITFRQKRFYRTKNKVDNKKKRYDKNIHQKLTNTEHVKFLVNNSLLFFGGPIGFSFALKSHFKRKVVSVY